MNTKEKSFEKVVDNAMRAAYRVIFKGQLNKTKDFEEFMLMVLVIANRTDMSGRQELSGILDDYKKCYEEYLIEVLKNIVLNFEVYR